jgi:uncharacterized metal-binding protein
MVKVEPEKGNNQQDQKANCHEECVPAGVQKRLDHAISSERILAVETCLVR